MASTSGINTRERLIRWDRTQFDVQLTVMTPFPGTPLYERLRAEGRLLVEVAWERCTLFDVNIRPKGMSSDALQHGAIELGRRLYTDTERKARGRRFRDQRRGFLRRQQAVRRSA